MVVTLIQMISKLSTANGLPPGQRTCLEFMSMATTMTRIAIIANGNE